MRKISALLAIIICTPALAAENAVELPDMVVTATRVPTPARNIAAGVTVIDRATIEDKGYNTLTDALADVPGLHVAASGGPGGQASVFMRGSCASRVRFSMACRSRSSHSIASRASR